MFGGGGIHLWLPPCTGGPVWTDLEAIFGRHQTGGIILRIVVLGGGRVGSAIVRDLAAEDDFSVFGVDLDPVRVERMTEFGADGLVADLSELSNVSKAVADADLVVGAVPGFMGYRTVERVLQEGKPIVDISFFPEDAFGLNLLAQEAGVCCLVDCGIAPGLSNLILGRMEEHLDETASFHCLVGGLPVERTWPWEYKAPFSPGDVIQEYVRPARLRRDGVEITMPALSEVELVNFPGLGSLEAFNTDGLRSLLRTCKTPDMVEKTMRYPGHAVRMRILREAGFFSTEEIQAASGLVRPRDVTEALLFSAWQFEEGEPSTEPPAQAYQDEAVGEETLPDAHGESALVPLKATTRPILRRASIARTTTQAITEPWSATCHIPMARVVAAMGLMMIASGACA